MNSALSFVSSRRENVPTCLEAACNRTLSGRRCAKEPVVPCARRTWYTLRAE
jgi:hypothetical protein